jgi:ABC-type sugar transport system permease subunit
MVIVVYLWKNVGFVAMIHLAGLITTSYPQNIERYL